MFEYQIKTPHSCILNFLRETILSFYQTRTHNNVSSRYQSYQSSSKILGQGSGFQLCSCFFFMCDEHHSTVKPPVSDHPECEVTCHLRESNCGRSNCREATICMQFLSYNICISMLFLRDLSIVYSIKVYSKIRHHTIVSGGRLEEVKNNEKF